MDAPQHRPRLCIVALNSAVPRLLGLVHDGAVGGHAVGGIEVQVVILARLLAERSWSVTLLVGDSGQAEKLEVDGITVVRALKRTGGALGKLAMVSQLLRSLRHTDCDIFLEQGASASAALTAFAAKVLGRKHVFWLASDTDAYCTDPRASRLPFHRRWIAAYALRTADLLIAQTDHQQGVVKERLGRESEVVHNPWPVGELKPHRHEPPTVLWVANLRWEKRPEMVLELAAAAPDVRFVMVGGPMPGNERLYERICQEQPNHPNLEYVGFVPFNEVGRYFEQASVFLNTSVVEGFPNSFLQAWDAGLPIVASFDPDGVLVREGLGYHCQTVDDFVGKIRMLLDQPQLRESMGQRAREHLRNQFGSEVVVGRLEHLLGKLDGTD